jgi:hypothetical protein
MTQPGWMTQACSTGPQNLGVCCSAKMMTCLAEAAKRQRGKEFFGGVIYAHQTGITIGRAIQDLQILADAGRPEDFANRVEYLPL